jgi:hypothetical protein
MVDRRVWRLLLSKLGVSQPAISQQAQIIKKNHGPMSTEEATYVIAHRNGIDLARYLPIEMVDRIRSLIPKELPSIVQPIQHRQSKKHKKKSATSYPLVTDALIAKGVSIGTESFPRMYILENSVRNLIIQRLTKAYGNDWWINGRFKGVRDNVQRIIDKEKKYPHRDKRGLHPIYYSNFSEIKTIILNEFNYFADVILDRQWFEVQMDQVYMSRNSLAHSVPITEDDESRIRLFYSEWSKLLDNAGIK